MYNALQLNVLTAAVRIQLIRPDIITAAKELELRELVHRKTPLYTTCITLSDRFRWAQGTHITRRDHKLFSFCFFVLCARTVCAINRERQSLCEMRPPRWLRPLRTTPATTGGNIACDLTTMCSPYSLRSNPQRRMSLLILQQIPDDVSSSIKPLAKNICRHFPSLPVTSVLGIISRCVYIAKRGKKRFSTLVALTLKRSTAYETRRARATRSSKWI